MHDLIITGGTIVDGTGAPSYTGDIAIDDGKITAVGDVSGDAKEIMDATGLLVTPGWVDTHTHYDGQATWDPLLTPSCWHGVTTAIMGNCGVGFAPVAPDSRNRMIELMESVEDISAEALKAGIDWQGESFPEYLDALAGLRRPLLRTSARPFSGFPRQSGRYPRHHVRPLHRYGVRSAPRRHRYRWLWACQREHRDPLPKSGNWRP